jgi:fatty acid-binding protein DegV
MVGVLTDTTASIPEELTRELGVEIVPYYIHRGLETLRDMVDRVAQKRDPASHHIESWPG